MVLAFTFIFLFIFFLIVFIKNQEFSKKESFANESPINDAKLASSYKNFARSNNLSLNPGVSTLHIYGNLHGYDFSLHIESVGPGKVDKGVIMRIKKTKALMTSKRPLYIEDIIHQYLAITNIDLPGQLKSNETHYADYMEIAFESGTVIKNEQQLKSIANKLVRIFEFYYELWQIGGENYKQTIQHIAERTNILIQPNINSLLCKKCLVFCTLHQANLPSSFSKTAKVKYYGCRLCKQSRDFMEGRPVSLLDNRMMEKLSLQDNEIQLNWLMEKKMFDFHEIRIIQASDKEVEEFVMQVGNDTDEFRRPRYKKMPCIVSSDCHLSANTMRLLQHTFHSVKTV